MLLSIIKDFQVVISASLAFLGTLYVIKANKLNARRKNAADIICGMNDDRLMVEGLEEIRKIIKGESSSSIFAELGNLNLNEEKRNQQVLISYVLNRYEYVAVGIDCGTYDEEIIKRSSYNKLIRIYDQCSPMIETTRRATGKQTIWSERETLAERWKKCPLQTETGQRRQPWWKVLIPW